MDFFIERYGKHIEVEVNYKVKKSNNAISLADFDGIDIISVIDADNKDWLPELTQNELDEIFDRIEEEVIEDCETV